MLTKLKHWWQRNFGWVYLTAPWAHDGGYCYAIRCRFGYISLGWERDRYELGTICKLTSGGNIVITDKKCVHQGRFYNGWRWSYKPTPDVRIVDGGYWR